MQTFMYSLLFSKKINDEGISPQIFYLKDFYKPRINSNIEIKETKEANDLPIGILNNFRSIEDQFKTEFELCLSEIFDYSREFSQTENLDNCKYCELKNICKR